jgi:hypothetical protein
MFANPTMRYAIVAGFDEEIREDVDEYIRAAGRELWGTVYTLTEQGEITWSDFPEDTAGILQDVARSAQQQREGQADD